MTIALTAAGDVSTNTHRCARLRQSILKWAFEGRLVDQDPTDEPACALLERIRAERASSDTNKPKPSAPRKARSSKT
jgi:type I restriction enzyme S subunit